MEGAELIIFCVFAAGLTITAVGSSMLSYGYFDEEDEANAEHPVTLSYYSGFATFVMGFAKALKKVFVDRSDPLVVALFIFLSGVALIGGGLYIVYHPEVLESLLN